MNNHEIYFTITNQIYSELQEGIEKFKTPWSRDKAISMPLRSNFVAYSGINTIILWYEASENRFLLPYWMTYRQAKELGGQVRKNQRATKIFYAATYTKTENNAQTGEEFEREVGFMKNYAVFNVAQIDGLPAKYTTPPALPEIINQDQRSPRLDAYFAALGAVQHSGGIRAFYRPTDDAVTLPEFANFNHAEAYYSTLAHEMIHWSGHESRLNRNLSGGKHSIEYAKEELVAELGAAFLCADLGISCETRPDHASYIKGFYEVMQKDEKALFTAASKASKAVAYLHNLAKFTPGNRD